MLTVKSETAIDEQNFIIGPKMKGRFEEARPCTLVTVVYRDGTPRLWPIKLPKDERAGQRSVGHRPARQREPQWSGGSSSSGSKRAYQTRDAQPGYAPDPDFSKLPPFDELVKLAFGEARDHPRREASQSTATSCGAPPKTTTSWTTPMTVLSILIGGSCRSGKSGASIPSIYPGPGLANGGREGDAADPALPRRGRNADRAELSAGGRTSSARFRLTGSTPMR